MKYIAWKNENVDGDIISLAILEIDKDYIYSSSINWKMANPKILAVHNKKRMLGALAENEYFIDNIYNKDIFDSRELACRNIIYYVFYTEGEFLKEKNT